MFNCTCNHGAMVSAWRCAFDEYQMNRVNSRSARVRVCDDDSTINFVLMIVLTLLLPRSTPMASHYLQIFYFIRLQSRSYHIRSSRHIRSPTDSLVARAIVNSRIDYCNSVIYGVIAANTTCLQRTRNHLANSLKFTLRSGTFRDVTGKQVQNVLWTRKGVRATVVTAGRCTHAELTSGHAFF